MKYEDFNKLKLLVEVGKYYSTSHCQGADENYYFYEEDLFDSLCYEILRTILLKAFNEGD